MIHVVFCAAEVAPFAKVGGLADVTASLPKALQQLGNISPTLILPRYGCISPEDYGLTRLPLTFTVRLRQTNYTTTAWKGTLPGSTIPVYFIEQAEFFSQDQVIYPTTSPAREVERFLFFSKAILAFLKAADLPVDILHAHDWHTCPLLVDLTELRTQDPFYKNVRSVLTVHNLAYQGINGDQNWMAQGLRFADKITTVSPTYAQEIQTPTEGAGLQDLVQERSADLIGILNGIDTELFNPETDCFIPEQYTADTAISGKALCKKLLQEEFGLSIRPELPLIGMVTRLVEQKGIELLMPVFDQLAKRPAQYFFVGAGDPAYESMLTSLNERYSNIRTYVGMNIALAQKVYAASDFFLMPSRFEPCGLGQMIALRYGSIPIARKVGGLADTVFDLRTDPVLGNGITFSAYQPAAMLKGIDAAIALYQDQSSWKSLLHKAMSDDFNWQQSAKQYRKVYQELVTH